MFVLCKFLLDAFVSEISLSDSGRGDDEESIGRREGDGDDRRLMEQDLVDGSVATAAAAALASAATKAKVKFAHLTSKLSYERNIRMVCRFKQKLLSVVSQVKTDTIYEVTLNFDLVLMIECEIF